MADLVTMLVTRTYPRGGVSHAPGEVIGVPEHAAISMEAANPPFGRRYDPESTVDIDATVDAMDLAAEHPLDLRPYVGKGSGPDGRIYQKDVKAWIESTT